MLDSTGSLVHIDFGYLLARTIKFEKAPFKLTEEMIEVIGGVQNFCCLVGSIALFYVSPR